MIAIVPATAEHALALAPRLRDGDAGELRAMGVSPKAGLVWAVERSLMAWTALEDGMPLMIWGAYAESILGDRAALWAMSGHGVERHKRTLLSQSLEFVETMQGRFPILHALVAVDYAQSVRWLRWLGFEAGEIETIGGQPFMRVWRYRPDYRLMAMPALNEMVH